MPSNAGVNQVPAGVILAGGRSRRMGGADKALLPLDGKPMLRHVIERVGPQVSELLVSVEQVSETYEVFGLRQVADPVPDGGPLGGVFSAMKQLGPGCDWLVLVPCDAPFVPTDLAARLLYCVMAADLSAAVIRYESELQPTFSIWNRCLLQQLEHAVVGEKTAGIKQFLYAIPFAELEWPVTSPSPFFNINDQDALAQAGELAAIDRL